jgi:hypothetical protein
MPRFSRRPDSMPVIHFSVHMPENQTARYIVEGYMQA